MCWLAAPPAVSERYESWGGRVTGRGVETGLTFPTFVICQCASVDEAMIDVALTDVSL